MKDDGLSHGANPHPLVASQCPESLPRSITSETQPTRAKRTAGHKQQAR